MSFTIFKSCIESNVLTGFSCYFAGCMDCLRSRARKVSPISTSREYCFQSLIIYSLCVKWHVSLLLGNISIVKAKKQHYIQWCKHALDQCPVHAFYAYFTLRKPYTGQLFTFMDGLSSRAIFSQQSNLSFNCTGCQSKYYKGHSFRIGPATSDRRLN